MSRVRLIFLGGFRPPPSSWIYKTALLPRKIGCSGWQACMTAYCYFTVFTWRFPSPLPLRFFFFVFLFSLFPPVPETLTLPLFLPPLHPTLPYTTLHLPPFVLFIRFSYLPSPPSLLSFLLSIKSNQIKSNQIVKKRLRPLTTFFYLNFLLKN